jgi:hypothetical protein
MSEQALLGPELAATPHPGVPRDYFGPLKQDPADLFVHTDQDLQNPDHFLEFLIGNGQMHARIDAMGSQHLPGRNRRGAIGIRHAEAWGAEAFAHFRLRPAGRVINKLYVDGQELQPHHLSNYHQSVDLQTGVLHTSFQWRIGNSCGSSTIKAFMSQKDRDVMVLSFCDRVESGKARRSAGVEVLVPYPHRLHERLAEAEHPAQPADNTQYGSQGTAQWLDYTMRSNVMQTKFCWYGQYAAHQPDLTVELSPQNPGGMSAQWDCPIAQDTHVDVVYAIVSDRSAHEPRETASALLRSISARGVDPYRAEHIACWQRQWRASTVQMGNAFWQKQFEIARYTLLINTGGSWLGPIAADEPAWDAHMLDSVLALNALMEWGHLDLVQGAYEALDRLYAGAAENARLVSDYVKNKLEGEAAILPTFLTYDGHVALYAINHFMLHSQQNAGHALGLWKLAQYQADDTLKATLLYRWMRAYANYALLISEWSEARGGYVFPMWKAGTLAEGEWWPLQMAMPPVDNYTSIADLFPEQLRQKQLECPLDVGLSHQWILQRAAEMAQEQGVDAELRERWQHVARQIVIQSNDEILLRHEHDDGKKQGHLPLEIWGLFYPCEGNSRLYDERLVRATLDRSYERRNPFIPSWNSLYYSIAFAKMGRADDVWRCLQELLRLQDPRCIQAQDNVGVPGFVYYYFLNYGFLLLTLRNALLNYEDGQVTLFPAWPRELGEQVSFTDLPIGGGLRVSAELNGDRGRAMFRRHDGSTVCQVTGRLRGYRARLEQLLANRAPTPAQ